MTRSGREQLVEQFLGCEMSLDQEREFVMQVATDPELFTLLRAYRVMDRALERGSTRLLATAAPLLGIGTTGLDHLPGMAQQQASSRASSATGVSTPSVVQVATATASSFSTWSVTAVVALLAASAGFLVRPMVAPTATDDIAAITTPTIATPLAPPLPGDILPRAISTPMVASAENLLTTAAHEKVTTGEAVASYSSLAAEPLSYPVSRRAPVSTRQAPITPHQQTTPALRQSTEMPKASRMDNHQTRAAEPRTVATPDTIRQRIKSSDSIMIKPKFDRSALPH